MEEKLSIIISFFAGALVAKNWSRIKLIFGAGEKEHVKRVKNEEKSKMTLAPRKKVIKRRRSAQGKQIIKKRHFKAHRSRKERPAVQPVAKAILEPTPAPNYKILELLKPEELSKPAPQEELKPAPESLTESLKPENTEGAEKEQAPKTMPDESKPKSNFWRQLIKKI